MSVIFLFYRSQYVKYLNRYQIRDVTSTITIEMRKIGITHLFIRSLQITVVVVLLYQVIANHFYRSVVIRCHRKESEFSFLSMTLYDNRMTKVTRSDLVSEYVTAIFYVPIEK